MVVYYHEAMYHAEKLVHYLQGKGHSEGLYSQNMVWWYIIKSQSVLWLKIDYCIQDQGHS